MFRTAVRNYSSRVGQKFQSLEQIKEYLKKPTWDTKTLLKGSQKSLEIDTPKLHRLLQLSGLSTDLDAGKERQLLNDLNAQLTMMNKLQEIECKEFDLIETQHSPLKFQDIRNATGELRQSSKKGETGQWNPLDLASVKSEGFYVVNEKLGKE
ncbi:Trimeric GatFAB AmidoTransferase(AdT) complex subunit [Komagataella phaffii CBS 7435]|uniref:Glutamyl-tRNA(Gln) amidotransferase subunit F, mitochondrial n=2 Tax=Komagataella phaffii TaxID=460519 RepID=GATF_KOMPG|nr:uncharacterized protein PAS_chr4_0715 [Komagataella phaffii GS115]C4R8Q1.1 RecName: Full=Glutamyl-tRNA(Gln) amidotransferase subunit F, mitochondrial; Short=Glu-AdT subunit F [Komagataella phaffii GS115]AOA64465.1 GQ67_05095T0 [Komagataella phaffii]CAH2450621.1 Trimeric GatFAB AmidoTransferase(AdT) complex subunit [Komagataella phaffii CBS 7435]AOA69524.1 GQ68_05077T0 [Komagataella phaffii GS115]CAY71976.1 Putative protein of unknown function [Komagataella phaffii GS115]CCA40423.1 Trimeric